MNKVAEVSETFTLKDFRWLTQAQGMIASLYNCIGHQKQCEQAYVNYVKLIEQNYGPDSILTANCYFLIGVFYFEQTLLTKAEACFRKSMALM